MTPYRASKTSDPAELAFLVGVSLPDERLSTTQEHLDELDELVETAGATVVGRSVQGRTRIDGATYVGAGKAREIKESCAATGANLLVFDNDLSPAQARNLEKILNINIIDRTELILDIFARRAKTQQAKIQVELAQLTYALPRLTKLWDHLSRQQGGIGTRGPGETQLEVDRRRIRQRMATLRRQLGKISRRRKTLREGRNQLPIAALVGYTNVGKSTLMRRLTGADVHVENRLFATLDTTTRKLKSDGSHIDVLSRNEPILLVDTVGFIRKLPDHLVTSFKATLEDVAQAQLYLHVVDASHPAFEEHMAVTDATLGLMTENETPTIHVMNKIDQVDPGMLNGLRVRFPGAVFVSARTGTGVPGLALRIARAISGELLRVEVKLDSGRGDAMAEVRRLMCARVERFEGAMCVLVGTIGADHVVRLERIYDAQVRVLL